MHVGEIVPAALADATVQDASAKSLPLRTFWASGPCLLVFLRHYGCVGCSEHVTELVPRLDSLTAVGVRVVFVGNGDVGQMEAFTLRMGLADKCVELVTDPGLAAYRAAGFERSAWATYGPRAMVESVRAMGAGHPHRAAEGDATQQGGVLLVGEGGTLLFVHRDRSVGDHAPTNAIVEIALRMASGKCSVRV